MDLAEAVAADRLWGWPVEVLDQLLLLQRQAWAGALSIEDWRTQDAALRAEHPPVNADEVGDTLAGWVASGELNLRDHGALLGRLTMLANPAPTDDDLWAELEAVLARANRGQSANLASVDNEQRDRITGWLTRTDSGIDEVTGLPWSLIAEHRAEGSVGTARQTALDKATESERQRADLLATRRDDLGTATDDWPDAS